MSVVLTDLAEGFSKLNREERFDRLLRAGLLSQEDISYLKSGGVRQLTLADQLIENSIGYFQLPLGVATHFVIDGVPYMIPMAVEETSIIAALSKTAKWIRMAGEITTSVQGACIIGQIQLAKVNDPMQFSAIFKENREMLIQKANQEVAFNMVERGGGVREMSLRTIDRPDGGCMMVIHLTMDSCDAMGANIINQVLEYLKDPIEQLTGERVTMCILSNLNDQKITSARVVLHHIDPELGERIEEASLFAELDPYRAATNNKGVMNGMDAVIIATGNDWRAVEAGVHAYAARHGTYQSITRWRYAQGELSGELTAPVIVGTVGGVTALHPSAKMCLRMMNISSANHLSRIIAAVGLVQNLGAIRALCTEGIIQGHMKLHIDNLLLSAGAVAHEIPVLKKRLQQWLSIHRRISTGKVMELLAELRHVESSL